jgi:hypothetical protein
MTTEPEIDKIKLNINEKYSLAKTNLLNKNMVFNISAKSVDDSYKNTIKKLDDEYNDFKKNKSHYSIITDSAMKIQKLSSELQKISNNFLVSINSIIDPKINNMIEEELLQNELNNKREKAHQVVKEQDDNVKKITAENVVFVVKGGSSWWW